MSARWATGVALALAWGCVVGARAELPVDELRFIEAMRSRRLFSLVEAYCRRGRDQAADSVDRADWTVELLKAMASRAANASRSQRATAWRQTRQEAQAFLQQEPRHPRRWLVQYQDALTLQAWAELLQYEAGDMQQAAEREEALELLREAASAWDQLSAELDRELAVRRSGGGDPQALTEADLNALKLNAAYQQARVLRFRAAAYPPKSPDHTAALQQALRKLEEVRVRLPEGNDLLWDVYADLLACRRDLQHWQEAEQVWTAPDLGQAPPGKADRLRAEGMRWRTAMGQPQRALELHQASAATDASRAPELDLALLETLLAMWREADSQQRKPEAARLQQRIQQTVEYIDQQYGPFWRRRADLLLLRAGPAGALGGPGLLVQRQANELVRQGKVQEAIDALDDALAATPQDDPERAFSLAYQAAVLTRQVGRSGEFLERVRDLALTYRQAKDASRAHFQAIVTSIALARTDPSMQQLYLDLLAEHLEKFADQPSADQVRVWRAQALAHQQQGEQAIQVLLELNPASSLAAAAARQAGLIALQSGVLSSTDAAARNRLIRRFRETAAQARQASNDVAQRAWTAWAAMLQAAFGSNGLDEAEAWLTEARAPLSAGPGDGRAAWAVVLAGRRQTAEALGALSELEDAQLLEAVLEVLAQSAERHPGDLRQGSAELLLKVLDLPPLKGQDQGPSATQRATLRAQAMCWAGRENEALALYERLAKEKPRDASLQVAWGQLLLDSKDPQRLAQALEQWRRIAAAAAPRSALWYRAKYSVALASFQAGHKDEAAQLIRYVKATTGWEDCPNRDAFERLLRRCSP